MSTHGASPMQTARIEAGLSRRAVAGAIGVSERTLMRWELSQAQPGADDAVRLARLLKRSVEEIVVVGA